MSEQAKTSDIYIKVDNIQPNRYQPRSNFTQKSLEELAQSIDEHGLVQPIIVRKIDDGENGIEYELVAGERRWRAHKQLELKRIQVFIKAEYSDESSMQAAVIENLQREDLTPLEEALAIRQLMDVLGLTQEQVAKRLGKSRSYISNIVRITALPDSVKNLLVANKLDKWHATAILGAPKEMQEELATKAAKGKWSVDTLKKKVAAVSTNRRHVISRDKPPATMPKIKVAAMVLLEGPSREAIKELLIVLEEEGGWNSWTGKEAFAIIKEMLPKKPKKKEEPVVEPDLKTKLRRRRAAQAEA